jgi:thiosulfate/3-mercaptopyruvate sulfurtransferase
MSAENRFTVSADWLQQRLGSPGLTIVDGSWYLPAQKREARAEYMQGHIPGAVFFDHDTVVDPLSDLPHTLPSPSHFEQHASSMGISHKDTIVVYDGPGMFSAPRVWWMFKMMGVENVYVLDGGFDRWKAEGRPVTAEATQVASCAFIPRFNAEAVAKIDEMMRISSDASCQIADARSQGRFEGTEPEPREGMRSGHMPGAKNIPVAELSRNGELKSPDELRKVFERCGVDLAKPVVTTCGSGLTAAVITLALHELGHTENKLYDGSWSEWGGRPDTPVETGPAKK